MDLISEIYNVDNIEYFMDDPKCSNCGKEASNRCSRCKSEWYCGKDCQKLRWKSHKEYCAKLANLEKENEPIQRNKNKNENENNLVESISMNKLIKEENSNLEIKNKKLQIKENTEENKLSIPEKEKELPKNVFDELDQIG